MNTDLVCAWIPRLQPLLLPELPVTSHCSGLFKLLEQNWSITTATAAGSEGLGRLGLISSCLMPELLVEY